jgi:hypothetical protein
MSASGPDQRFVADADSQLRLADHVSGTLVGAVTLVDGAG